MSETLPDAPADAAAGAVPDAVSDDGSGHARADEASGVWAPERRRLTAALVLTITLVAFESLAIATVMPVVSDDLGGLGLYGWVFSGFFLGSLVGIVLAGWAADRRGTRLPFAAGLVLFTVGLVVGGLAPTMGILVVGRVLQGAGAGVIPAVAYATVARSYPSDLRPRVFAVFSTAWVVPGLLGPAAASGIEHLTSWRVVFLALLPLVAVAAGLVLPVLSDRAPADDPAEPEDERTAVEVDAAGASGSTPGTGGPQPDERRRNAVVLVAGTALFLGGLGAHQPALAVALVVAGLVPAVWAFVRLVPVGTVRLQRGMPAAVAVRGILTFAFFGTDAFVTLAVTDVHDGSTLLGSAALTGATLAWTTGAWVQQRVVLERGPRWLVQRGFALIAVGVAALALALRPGVPVAATLLAWTVAGLGMGLSYAPISATVLGLAESGLEGRASSSLQLTDVLGVAIGTGLAGVFVALGDGRDWATSTSLTFAFAMTAAVAALGVAAASRLPRRLPGVDTAA